MEFVEITVGIGKKQTHSYTFNYKMKTTHNPAKPQVLQVLKRSWPLVLCASLLLGIVGIVSSTYIQHHDYWSDTMYGINQCTEQSPGLPGVPNPSAPKIPDLTGCTGVRVGWPATFIASDIQISVGINNPKLPLTISELDGFSDLHLNLGTFLVDWVAWSAVGFVVVYSAVYYRTKKANQ